MNMLEVGVLLKLTDHMTGGMRGAIGTLDSFGGKLDQLSEKANRMGRAQMANGMIMMGLMKTPIQAFADLDEASTNLRVAMMDNLGKIPPQFAEINKQAVELGNLLPGTTADFTNAATALLENGTKLNQVIGGGLKAASYLSVILKMPARDAAEMVAKFRESFGLAEHELTKMADLTQKAKFAFGLNPDEIKYAAQYMGASLNALHLTGAENARTMLAFQGYARQKGMDGSVFGTNFAQMLNQIGQMESKLGRNSKPMREVNEELKKYGVHMQFFSNGKFIGLKGMIGEIEKLQKITDDDKRLFLLNKIFGMEGGRVASTAMQMGVEGLQNNLALMDKQADIMQRIDTVTKSAKNTWDAFTGTVTNLMAALGGPAVEAIKPFVKELNDLTGGPLMKWVDENRILVEAGGKLILGFGALAIVVGSTALAIGGFTKTMAVINRFFGGGKGGALGVLGGAASHAAPIPVFVVNQTGLPGSGMPGVPGMPGGEKFKDMTKMGKIGFVASRLPAVAEAAAVGWEIGSLISDSMTEGAKDFVGSQVAHGLALFGNKEAQDTLKRMAPMSHDEMLKKQKKDYTDIYEKSIFSKNENKAHLHITLDAQGRASADWKGDKPKSFGLSFNAHAGPTMVTP